jgi:hypothetical protein
LRNAGICEEEKVPSILEDAIKKADYYCIDNGGCFEVVDDEGGCIYHCDNKETYLDMETYRDWETI